MPFYDSLMNISLADVASARFCTWINAHALLTPLNTKSAIVLELQEAMLILLLYT